MRVLATALVCWVTLVSVGHASIGTDGTVGPAQALTGPNYSITANLGTQVGTNLFHSFSVFNIFRGESATFSGPTSVSNIISRVTGGSASTIDGLLRSTIPGANLFFLNPSGVMFGPHAQLDVQGSFHVSTADYIRLADGSRFDATNQGNSALTIAPPAAFGFLGTQVPAPISFQGTTLTVPQGRTFSIVGGDISIVGDPLAGGSLLQAPVGRIQLASVASAGEVSLDPSGLGVSSFQQLGNITIANGSAIDVSDLGGGLGGGSVFIRGGVLTVTDGSIIDVSGYFGGGSGSVDIGVTGDILMVGSDPGAAPGAMFDLSSGLFVRGGLPFTGGIVANSLGTATGGTIKVSAQNLTLQDGSEISTDASGSGQGGSILLNVVGNLTLTGINNNGFLTGVFATSGLAANSVGLPPGAGPAGNTTIKANNVTIQDGAEISTATVGAGKGGNILMDVGSLTVSGVDSQTGLLPSGVIATSGLSPLFSGAAPGSGNGGSISITGNNVIVQGGAEISTASFGPGKGGSMVLDVGTVTLSGTDVSGVLPSGLFASSGLDFASSLFSSLFQLGLPPGSGNAGSINIKANSVMATGGAGIYTNTVGSGLGGDVVVNAGSMTLSGIDTPLLLLTRGRILIPSGIFVTSGNLFGGNQLAIGKGGTLQLTANELALQNGAAILSATFGPGTGGNASLNVGALNMSGSSLISAASFGSGSGGSLNIMANTVTLQDNAALFSAAFGQGQGGSASLNVGALNMSGFSLISAASFGSGSGGSLNMNVGALNMSGPSLISDASLGTAQGCGSTAPGCGAGGRTTIKADTVTLTGGAEIINGTIGPGEGGNVTLEVGSLTASGLGSGILSVPAGSGVAGTLTITATNNVLLRDGALISTSTASPVDASPLNINAGSLALENGSQILASTLGTGRGGSVVLNAGSLVLSGVDPATNSTSQILATSGTPSAPQAGDAGSIVIKANGVTLQDGAAIATSTNGPGKGGPIVMDVGSMTASGVNAIGLGSGIFARSKGTAPGSGDGGSININAGDITLQQGAEITVETLGPAKGGNIVITANRMTLSDNNAFPLGSISARSSGTGNAGNINISLSDSFISRDSSVTAGADQADGGNITLNVTNLVHLTNSEITATVKGGTGHGGNITIDPIFVILDNGSKIIANAFGGDGGNILIVIQQGGAFLKSPDSVVSASSTFGVNGTVEIRSPDTDIGGKISTLPASFLDKSSLLTDRCAAARSVGQASSLVVTGRGGVPAGPGALLTASYLDSESGFDTLGLEEYHAQFVERRAALEAGSSRPRRSLSSGTMGIPLNVAEFWCGK